MAEQNEQVTYTKEDIETNKTMAIIAYFIFFIPLLVDPAKDSPYARFHVNQGFVLVLAAVAVQIIGALTTVILIGFIILPVGSIFVLVLWVIGLIGAINGEAKKVPVLGNITLIK